MGCFRLSNTSGFTARAAHRKHCARASKRAARLSHRRRRRRRRPHMRPIARMQAILIHGARISGCAWRSGGLARVLRCLCAPNKKTKRGRALHLRASPCTHAGSKTRQNDQSVSCVWCRKKEMHGAFERRQTAILKRRRGGGGELQGRCSAADTKMLLRAPCVPKQAFGSSSSRPRAAPRRPPRDAARAAPVAGDAPAFAARHRRASGAVWRWSALR